ncbi:MAG: cytochrome c [Nitrospirota bacterium]|nr:cytochrome c [Nitrospirota bacterium]
MPFLWAPMWHFKRPRRLTAFALSVGMVVGFTFGLTPLCGAESPTDVSDSVARGKRLYEHACLLCHGNTGQGDGPDAFYLGAYSAPRPRDFTGGEFKFRSTPSGELPTDDDLYKTISRGIPGYMPSFRGLSEAARWDIVRYVKHFSPLYQEADRTPIALAPGPLPATTESVNRGREVYDLLDCAKCHGPQAMQPGGLYDQGELRDRRELNVLPPDLSHPSSFKNGHQPSDIAQSILTGLDGSPMASFREALTPHPEDIWHLVNYLLSLSQSP